jgi:hypothetical protein
MTCATPFVAARRVALYAHVEAHDLKSGIARLETFVASHTPEETPPDSGARRIGKPRRKAA